MTLAQAQVTWCSCAARAIWRSASLCAVISAWTRRCSSAAAASSSACACCSQNGYLSSRGGCQNRWHSLVNCDYGDSTSSRFDSPPGRAPRPRRGAPWHAPTAPTSALRCSQPASQRGNGQLRPMSTHTYTHALLLCTRYPGLARTCILHNSCRISTVRPSAPGQLTGRANGVAIVWPWCWQQWPWCWQQWCACVRAGWCGSTVPAQCQHSTVPAQHSASRAHPTPTAHAEPGGASASAAAAAGGRSSAPWSASRCARERIYIGRDSQSQTD
jgi:hypothetical protein